MARLSGYVWVADERGQMTLFGPDDDVPAWATQLIRNPRAWAEAPPADAPPEKMTKADVFPEMIDDAPPADDTAATADTDTAEDTPVGTPPPHYGKGSGRAPWAEYATRNGVDVAAHDGRDDIIARLTRAGVPI